MALGKVSVILDLVAKKFNKDVMGTQKKIARFAQKARKSINRISFRRAALSAAALGYALTRLTKHFLSAASQIEGYQIALSKTLGSMEEGNKLFNYMSKFAQTVAHEFKDLMGSAVTLSGIMKGGADEVIKWIPLLSDLGAYTKLLGIEMWETTSQIVRFFSTGAAAADLFREKGVLALLGFTAGVHYTVEETKEKLMKAWVEPKSKFRGLAKDLAKTWIGLMSMLKDAWFQARLEVMKGGFFEFLKKQIDALTSAIKRMTAEGKFVTFGTKLAEEVVKLKYAVEALVDVLQFSGTVFKGLTWPAAITGEGLAKAQLYMEEQAAYKKSIKYKSQMKGWGPIAQAEHWRGTAKRLVAENIINKAIGWRLKTMERLDVIEKGIARAAELRASRARARYKGTTQGLGEIGSQLHRRVVERLQAARGEIGEALKEGGLYISPIPEDAQRDWEAVTKMIEKAENRWIDFSEQVKWSWSSTIEQMISGTMRFGDVAKRMIQDVMQSYIRMISQMAGERLFESTASFFRALPGLGSVGVTPGGGEVNKGYPALSAAGGVSIGNLTIAGPDADQIIAIINKNVKRKGALRRG